MPSSSGSPTKLTTRISDEAPRSATILSRQHVNGGAIPTYNLKVGGVIVPNVSLEELFDFISPQDLEAFENASFKRENDEMDMIQQALYMAKRRPGRPRKDRTLSGTGSTTSREESAASSRGISPKPEVATTTRRFGRPRPDYTGLYPKRGRRGPLQAGSSSRADFPNKQRSIDSERDLPRTAASLSLDDKPKRRRLDHSKSRSRLRGSHTPSSSAGGSRSYSSDVAATNGYNTTSRGKLPDKVETPEPLIPLSSLRAGASAMSNRSSSTASSTVASSTSPSAQLAAEMSRSRQPTSPIPKTASAIKQVSASASSTTSSSTGSASRSGSDSISRCKQDTQPLKAPAQALFTNPEDAEYAEDSEAESSTVSSSSPSSSDSDQGSYEIERILSHHFSDPRTHPPELGKKPVMLYQVIWAGYDETTWEPEESFDDKTIVARYLKGVREASQGSRGKGEGRGLGG
ncbi:Hypothetical protein D9617_7g032460 [Elsinoe fawcettii]|nr:Hypothetical protein D9617_7g032460 [Elsinoe fawcettii]